MNKKQVMGLIGGLVCVVIAVALAVNVDIRLKVKDVILAASSVGYTYNATDVIGTKVVTTTVGVDFGVAGGGGTSATTTYITNISQRNSQAVYTIKAVGVSSTAHAYFEVMGSQDYDCISTATSGGDRPLASEISWFNVGDHLKGKVHGTSFSNVSSTASFMWANPAINVGNEIVLVDLDYECLRLAVSGSSTVLHAQISTK